MSGARIGLPLRGSVVLATLGLVLATGATGLWPSVSAGAGLRNAGDGWLLEAEDLARMTSATSDQTASTGLWLRAAHARLYGLTDLPVAGLTVGWAATHWRLAGAWQRTGADLLMEERWQVRLDGGDALRCGLVAQGGHMVLAGEAVPGATQPALYLGGRVAPGRGLFFHWDVWAPLGRDQAGSGGRLRRLRLAVIGAGWGLATEVSRRGDGVPVAGFDAAWTVGADLALSLRLDPSTAALGPGLAYGLGGLQIRTSHVVHPRLGVTHRFEVAWGRSGGAPW